MKIIHLLFSGALLATIGCSSPVRPSFLIDGKADRSDGKTVTLFARDSGEWQPIAHTVVEQGRYTMRGEFPLAGLAALTIENDDTLSLATAFILSNDTFCSQVTEGGIEVWHPYKTDVIRSLSLLALQRADSLAAWHEEYKTLFADKNLTAEIEHRYEEKVARLDEKYRQQIRSSIVANDTTEVGLYLFLQYRSAFSEKEQAELYSRFSPDLRRNEPMIAVRRWLDVVDQVSAGCEISDYPLYTERGRAIPLHQYIGQYCYRAIFVWASWNTLSAGQWSELRSIYRDFYGFGLRMIDISIDTDRNAWQASLKDVPTGWRHFRAVEPESETPDFAQTMGIEKLPYIILVDPKGKIVARDLTVATLRQTLETLSARK